MLAKKPPSPQPSSDYEFSSGLSSLPYDLLLNIATFLDLRDVHALHLVSNLALFRDCTGRLQRTPVQQQSSWWNLYSEVLF
jgi:hypothetical protein